MQIYSFDISSSKLIISFSSFNSTDHPVCEFVWNEKIGGAKFELTTTCWGELFCLTQWWKKINKSDRAAQYINSISQTQRGVLH